VFIIQVTDIHSTFSDNCRDTVEQFVKEANTLRPNFIVATGDLVMDANPLSKEEDVEKYYLLYKSLMKDLKQPLFNLPGNHEHPWAIPESSPLYNRGAFKHFLGPVYYSFDYSNWHFVMLEATIDKKDGSGFDDVQLNWLEKDLSLSKNKPTIIFTHQPPFECKNFAKFLTIIAQNKQVKAVFSGHEHANIYLPLGDILNILTGALSASWWGDNKPNLDGTPRGYRLIILRDGDYETAYKWVGEKHSVDVPFLMREATLKGKVAFKINVYDEDDSIEGVAVRLDSTPPLISLIPASSNKFWKTYVINLDTTSFSNGEHSLIFYAVSKKAVGGKRLWKLEYPIKIENEQ
ncbi:metallophosphoesterase, partial [bacterium]|nr:metallophosphoesterase [bacterium]